MEVKSIRATTSTRLCRSGHLHSESLARPLVDVVRDGDGGRDLAEVGDDAAVQSRHALVAQDVPGGQWF